MGKERDEETGLYYYGFRYYASWIARFINVDPLQHEYPQLTPFQYASNNPVTLIDLDGLEGVARDFNFMPEAEPFRKDTPNTQRSSLSHNIQLYEIQQVNGDEIISGETIGSEIHRLRGDGFDYYLTPIVDKNKSIIGYNVFTEEYRIDYVISSKDLPAFIQNRTLFRNAADLFNMNKSEDMVRLAAASSKQDIDAAMGALGALWAANWKQALIEGVFNFAMGYASGSAISRNARPKPNVGGGAAKGGFGSMMEAGEAARYAKYWESYAPKQISPGTTRMDWIRVSGRTGKMESSRVIYDNFGRQIYRVDFSNHMRPVVHSEPHLHQYQYGRMSSFGKESVFNFR